MELLKMLVSRMLPQRANDNSPGIPRIGTYGDLYTVGLVRKQHGLADEGAYYVANNGQTGVAMGAVASFGATTPFVVVANTDSPSNNNAKRIYLDYLNLIATAAGSAASGLAYLAAALVLDTGNRFSSGGSGLSNNIVNPNMDVSGRSSIAQVTAGAVTATGVTASARTIVGQRNLRQAVSATVALVVGDEMQINFGGVEVPGPLSVTVASPQRNGVPFPPCVIGPGQSALFYLWLQGAATPAAASLLPELGWWER